MPDFKFLNQVAQQVQSKPQPTNINNLYPTLNTTEINSNGRYPTFNLEQNNEDIYAQRQGTGEKWRNGLLKGLLNVGTTVVGGTAGLIRGAYEWSDTGKFSSFYDNDITRQLDRVTEEANNSYLPNYESLREKNADVLSTTTFTSANFWADTILKNVGFAAGAYLSGGAWSKVLKGVGSIANAASAGKLAELGVNVERGLLARSISGIEGFGAKADQLAKIGNTINKVKDIGSNAVRAGFATFGEASIEALQARNTYKEELVAAFKNQNGFEPSESDLLEIDSQADKVGNMTMGLNTALLTATNYIQFPKIAGTFWKAERAALSGAERGLGRVGFRNAAGETVEAGSEQYLRQGTQAFAVRPATKLGRLSKTIKPYLATVFSPSEAFEEGAQFVIPTSTKDYYEKGKDGDNSIFDSAKEGFKQLFKTKEGQMSLLAGGLTGGLMQNANPFSKGGAFKSIKQARRINNNTNDFVSRFNNGEITFGSGYTMEMHESLTRGVKLNEEATNALRNNNRFAYQEAKTDQILNWMLPRIQYGRFDLVNADLDGMMQVASTEEGFAQLIESGQAKEGMERQDFLNNLNSLKQMAETTNNLFENLNTKYGPVLDKDGSRKYNEQSIQQLAYTGSKINDYNNRITSLLPDFTNAGIDINTLLGEVAKNGLNEDTQAQLNDLQQQIQDLQGLSPEIKEDLLNNSKDLVELTARREFKIREYELIRDNPKDYLTDSSVYFSTADKGGPDMAKVNFNTVEDEETEGDHRRVFDLVNKGILSTEFTQEEEALKAKYPNLVQQLEDSIIATNQEAQGQQAEREGWWQNERGEYVPPTSKSQFFDMNQGDYTMTVNGVSQTGNLAYNPDTNSLYFQYGNQEVEVFNEDFNDQLITPLEGTTIDTGYLSEEDTSAPNRSQVRLGNYINEVTQRQKQVESEIAQQLRELLNISEELDKTEQTATEFTKDYVETMDTLSTMKQEVEVRYGELYNERLQLENVQGELNTLLQNLPLTLKSSQTLLERQSRDLESLSIHTNRLIPALQNIQNSAQDLLNRFGKKVISKMAALTGIPPSPNFQRVRDLFTNWETTNSNEDLDRAVQALNTEYQNIQNFELSPLSEADVKWAKDKIQELQTQLRGVEPTLRAKQQVLDRIAQLQEETLVREEIVRTIPQQPQPNIQENAPNEQQAQEEVRELNKEEEQTLKERVEELIEEGKTPEEANQEAVKEWETSERGQRQEQVRETTIELFDEDSDRTPISRYFNSTTLLPKEMRNKSYDLRLNNFINKIGIFDKNRRKNLRLLTVTRKNEASLGLDGFVERFFKVTDSFDKSTNEVVGDNPIDAPIGLVMVEEVNGQYIFIDQEGNRLDAPTLDNILLTKMKAASLTWSTGQIAYSDPTGLGEDVANLKREEFEQQRREILESPLPIPMSFRTSQGRAKETSATNSPSIVGNLITQEEMKGKKPLIEVVTGKEKTKTLPSNLPGEKVQVKVGTILLRTEESLQKLFTRKLTDGQKSKIVEALTYLRDNRSTPNTTLQQVREYIEGTTFIKFGSNLETISLRGNTYTLDDKLNFLPLLSNQNTNVREGFIKNNKAFREFLGLENGEPNFKDWETYQEYLLSDEGGRTPLVYAPMMVDKYFVFSPDLKVSEAAPKPPSSNEVVAGRQVQEVETTNKQALVKNQTEIIKVIQDFFTRYNEEGSNKNQEKQKAQAAGAVILRMGKVMVERGIYPDIQAFYESFDFTNLRSRLEAPKPLKVSDIQVESVVDYTRFDSNKNRPNEQLRFGQGVDFEPVVIVGDSEILELSSLAAKDNKSRIAKNPVYLTEAQKQRKRELEQKLGISGTEVNTRLKEIAKENRDKNVEKIVRIILPKTNTVLNQLESFNITNFEEILKNGSGRVNVDGVSFKTFDVSIDRTDNTAEVGNVEKTDPTKDKGAAYQTYIQLGRKLLEEGITLVSTPSNAKNQAGVNLWNRLVKEGFAVGSNSKGYRFKDNVTNSQKATAKTVLLQMGRNEEVTFKTAKSVETANENPLLNLEGNKVIGAFDTDTNSWVGIPRETTNQDPKGAISLIEGAQAIIFAQTGEADISTILHEMAHFYEANALTEEERQTLLEEAGENATPEEVSEYFARGFESYLAQETKGTVTQTLEVEGQTPRTLSTVFRRLREFMVEIYDSIVGSKIDLKLSQNMKQIYHDMLGLEFSKKEARRKGFTGEVVPTEMTEFTPQVNVEGLEANKTYNIVLPTVDPNTATLEANTEFTPLPEVTAVQDKTTKEVTQVNNADIIGLSSDKVIEDLRKKTKEGLSINENTLPNLSLKC